MIQKLNPTNTDNAPALEKEIKLKTQTPVKTMPEPEKPLSELKKPEKSGVKIMGNIIDLR